MSEVRIVNNTCIDCGVRFDHRFAEHLKTCPSTRNDLLEDWVKEMQADCSEHSGTDLGDLYRKRLEWLKTKL